MENFYQILSDEEYKKLNYEYSKIFTYDLVHCSDILNNIISNLSINSFKLSLNTQNNVLCQLQTAKQLFDLLYTENNNTTHKINNNPFKLIDELCNVANILNKHTIKSPFQTIYLKISLIIINCIKIIAEFFDKKLN